MLILWWTAAKRAGLKEPDFLMEALRFQNYLEGLNETGEVDSIIDYIRKMNQAMHNDDPEYYVIPETRNLVAQYLLLYENTGPEEELSDLKTMNERIMRMSIRVKNMTARNVQAFLYMVNRELKEHYPSLKVETTGSMVVGNSMDIYVQDGIVASFMLALTIISLSMFLLFRSFKYGSIVMVSSIFPILFAGGVMAVLDISLDLGTMIVGAMTMGIAVDDSIHIMERYLKGKKNGKNVTESIRAALTESGKAVIFTSVILISGFSVMLFSSFIPFIYMGIFVGIIMFTALLADLFLLPSFVFILDRDKVGEKTIDLKEEPKVTNSLSHIIILITVAVTCFIHSSPAYSKDLTAREVMVKVDERYTGDTSILDTTMVLIDKRGNRRVRKTKLFSKEFGEDSKSISFFLSPADVKNTAFLSFDWDDDDKEDDSWLYLPALRKVKRIASSDKSKLKFLSYSSVNTLN